MNIHFRIVLLVVAAILAVGMLPALAQEPVQITIWHMEQPPHRVERIQLLIDEFNAANPDVVVR